MPLPAAPVCTVTTVAGADTVLGSVDGEPDLTRFNQPMGISYDPMMDTFFVANRAGDRLARYHRSTRMTETVFEGPGYVDGGIADAKAENMYNIARLPGDPPRFVFGDGRPVLRLYDVDAKTVSFIAGGTAVSTDGAGAAGQFRWISAVTALRAEPDRVVVTDHVHDCLRSVTISAQSVTTLSGQCAVAGYDLRPGTSGRWDGPFDPSEARHNGALYVPEMVNRVVRLMDATTGESSLVAGSPRAPPMIVDGPALTTARFHYPATCRTSRDVLFIAEGEFSAVRALHFSTMYVITLVSHHRGVVDGSAPSTARLWKPHFADTDCDGALYVTEYKRHTIRKVQCSWPGGEDTGNLLPQCAAKRKEPRFECTIGTIGGIGSSGNAAGDYDVARLSSPYGMAYDPGSDELHIADYLNHDMNTAHVGGRFVVRAFGTPTMDTGGFATAGAESIYDLAKIPGHDHRFLAINNDNGKPSVRLVDTTAKTVAFIAGGTVGFSDGAGAAASFKRVSSITFFREDPSIAFIPDHGAQCIRSVVLATGVVSTPSGVCSDAVGHGGYNPAAGASAKWWHPFEMGQANGTRRLYVADGFNYVIRLWDTVSGLSPAIAGKVGVADTADGPAMGTARFRRPVALSVAADVVYIGDTWHGLRALVLSDDYVVTISGNKPTVSRDGALPHVGRIKVDYFHEVDCDGNLFLSDYESHVVRTVQCKWPGRAAHSEAYGCDVRRQRRAFPFQCEVSSIGRIGVSGKQGGKFDTMRWGSPFGMAFDPGTDELLTVAFSIHALFSVHVPSEFAQILVEGANQTNGPWAGASPAGMEKPYNIHKISGHDHRFLVISNDNGAPQLRLVDTAAKTVSFIAGSTVGFADGIGAAAQFQRTSDVIVLVEDLDVAYIPDHGAKCFRRVQLSTAAVTTSSGVCGSAGGYDPSAGNAAKWAHPFEVAQANGTRRMYVADMHNTVVRLYDTVSGLSPLIAGQVGVSHLSDGPALVATFLTPTSVVVTRDVLYIGDREGGVRALVLAHDYIVSITAITAKAVYPGVTETSRDGPLPHVGRIRINHFQELDCDGTLYVSDYQSDAVRVVKCQWPGLDVNGTHVGCEERRVKPTFQCDISSVGKIGDSGLATGEYTDTRFFSNYGMAYDPGTDELLITDHRNHALTAAHVNGEYTTVVAEGDSQSNGDFSAAGMQRAYNIQKIPGHDHRFLMVSNDNGAPQLRLVDTAAKTVSFIAGSTVGFADGVGAAAQFRRISTAAVLVEDLDVAYIPDHGARCIRRVQLSTAAVTTSSGTCDVGPGYDPSAGSAAKWGHPFEAVQANGTRRMYIGDMGNKVVRLYDTVSGLSPGIAGIVGDNTPKDGPAHLAAFRSPAAIAVTKDIVYIGDVYRGLRALVLPVDYVVSLSGPSSAAVWPDPGDEALDGPLPHVGRIRINYFHEVDCDGNLFLSDYESHVMRIVKCKWPGLDISATHVGCAERRARVQPQCSVGSIGKIDAKAATTPVTGSWSSTRLNTPFGMAYDPMTDALHIADVDGNTVVEALVAPRTTRALITGPTNTEGPFGSAGALRPHAVTKVPGQPRFLMTTQGAAASLRSYNVETATTAFIAGGGPAPAVDGAGAAARFARMVGFRVMRGDLDVAYSTDRHVHSIRRVQLSTALVTTVSGNGVAGYSTAAGSAGRWQWPFEMVQSHDLAQFYVADTHNYVIRLFSTADTTSPPRIGQPGQRQRVDGPATTTARLMQPLAVSITKDVLYIGELMHGLRALLIADDYVITLASVGIDGVGSRDGPLSSPGRIRSAYFAEVDCDGGLYLSDYNSHVVRTVSCSWPAAVSLESPEPSCALRAIAPKFECVLSSIGDGSASDVDGPFATAKFHTPMGVAFDPFWGALLHTGRSGNSVRQIDIRSGEVKTLYTGAHAGTGAFSVSGAHHAYNVQRLPGDGHHRFIVTHDQNNPRVHLVDVSAGTTEHLAGSTTGTNDGIGSAARFTRPTCAVFFGNDSTEAVIVDDMGNCIRRLVLATKALTTISGVCGARGFNIGAGSTARWSGPFESAQANGTGMMYVPEMVNRVVRLLDISDGSSVVVAGRAGVEARMDGPATSVARFEYPGSVVVTRDVVYIAEGMRPHLRALVLPLDYVVTIVTGAAESVDGAAPGPARLKAPHFMDVDCDGQLWIGDFLANRIRRVVCSWPSLDASTTNPSCPTNEAGRTATDTQSSSVTVAGSVTDTSVVTASVSTATATLASSLTPTRLPSLTPSMLPSLSLSTTRTTSISAVGTASKSVHSTATVSVAPTGTRSLTFSDTASLRPSVSRSAQHSATVSSLRTLTVSQVVSGSGTTSPSVAASTTATSHESSTTSSSMTLSASPKPTPSVSVQITTTRSAPSPSLTRSLIRSDTASLQASSSRSAQTSVTASYLHTMTVSRVASRSSTPSPSLALSATVTSHDSASTSSSKTLSATPNHTSSVSVRSTATRSAPVTATKTSRRTLSNTRTLSVHKSASESIPRTVSATASESRTPRTRSASGIETHSCTVFRTASITVAASPSRSRSRATASVRASASRTHAFTRSVSFAATMTRSTVASVSVSVHSSLSASISVTASQLHTVSLTLLSSATQSDRPSRTQTSARTSSASTTPTASRTLEGTPSLSAAVTGTMTSSWSSTLQSTQTMSRPHTKTTTWGRTLSSTVRVTASTTVHSTPSPSRASTMTASAIGTATHHWTRTASMTRTQSQSKQSATVTAAASRTVSIAATGSSSLTHSLSRTAAASASRTDAASATASRGVTVSLTTTHASTITGSVVLSGSPTPSLALPVTGSTTVTATPTVTTAVSVSRTVPTTATRSSLATASASVLLTATALALPTKTLTGVITATLTHTATSAVTSTQTTVKSGSVSHTWTSNHSATLTRTAAVSASATGNGTHTTTPTTSKTPNKTLSSVASSSRSHVATPTRPMTPSLAPTVTDTVAATAALSATRSHHATSTLGHTASGTVAPAPGTSTPTRAASPTLLPLVPPLVPSPPVRRTIRGAFSQLFGPDGQCPELTILATAAVAVPALVVIIHVVVFIVARCLPLPEEEPVAFTALAPKSVDPPIVRSGSDTETSAAPATTNESTRQTLTSRTDTLGGSTIYGECDSSYLSWWQFALVEHAWACLFYFPCRDSLASGYGVPHAVVWAARAPVLAAACAVLVGSSLGQWGGAGPALLFGFAAAGSATVVQPLLSWGWRASVLLPGAAPRGAPILDRGAQDLVVFGVPRYRQTIGVSKATYDRLDELDVLEDEAHDPAPPYTGSRSAGYYGRARDSSDGSSSGPEIVTSLSSAARRCVPHVACGTGSCASVDEADVGCSDDPTDPTPCHTIDVVPVAPSRNRTGWSRSSGPTTGSRPSLLKWRPPTTSRSSTSTHAASMFLHSSTDTQHERKTLRGPPRVVTSRIGVIVASLSASLLFVSSLVATVVWAAPWCRAADHHRWAAFSASVLVAVAWDVLVMQPLHGTLRALHLWMASEDGAAGLSLRYPLVWERLRFMW